MNKIEYYQRFFELSSNKDENYINCPICGYKYDLNDIVFIVKNGIKTPNYNTVPKGVSEIQHCNKHISVRLLSYENAQKKYYDLDNMTFQDYWILTY